MKGPDQKRAFIAWIAMLFSVVFVKAQTVTIDNLLGVQSATQNAPVGAIDYHAGEHLYLNSEIGVSGSIGFIRYNATADFGIPVTAFTYPVNVYMKSVSAATTTLTSGVYTTTGYTLVYTGNFDVSAAGWNQITLTTPFAYSTADNLEVLVERTTAVVGNPANAFLTAGGTGSPARSRRFNSATAPVSGTTSLTASAFRAAIQLVFIIPCTGAPIPGATLSTNNPVHGCPTTLSIGSDYTGITGISYDWQSSPTGAGGSYVSTGGTGSTFTTSPGATTFYQCMVTCSGSGLSGISTPVQIDFTTTIDENFEASGFPPNCWIADPDWTRGSASSGGVGTGSAFFNFYNVTNGTIEDMITHVFDPAPAGSFLNFSEAYAPYDDGAGGDYPDTVLIGASTDGGLSYVLVATLYGGLTGNMVTAAPTGAQFIPSAAQWGNQSIAIPAGTNNIVFEAISDFGNDFYIDNINIGAAPLDEAAVNIVYTLGKMALGYSANHVVQAVVRNNGSNSWTKDFTLDITGANSFSDVQSVTLAPNASTIVSFAPFTATATGLQTVTVSVGPDNNNTDNAYSVSQEVNVSTLSYKEPGVANEPFGIGFNGGTGDFVAGFTTADNYGNPDTLSAIKVDFVVAGAAFQYAVWAADGVGGIPGTLLFTSTPQTTIIGTAFLAVPDLILSGKFYVGVQQTDVNNVGFAYQSENPIRPGNFYFQAPNNANGWTDFTDIAVDFRFAIEAEFNFPVPPNCAILQSPDDGGSACGTSPILQWASGGGVPTSYDVYFGTITPPPFLINVATTTFNPTVLLGVTYYWRIIAKNAQGDASGCDIRSFSSNAIPTGNTFADPIIISSTPYSVFGDNLSSNCWSDEYTDPNPPGNASPDVFYKVHTGNCTDSLAVFTCNSASGMDTYIHILDGSGNELYADDDGCGIFAGPSFLYVKVTPNSDYFIVVEGFAGIEGDYQLDVIEVDNPSLSVTVNATNPPVCSGSTLNLTATLSYSAGVLWDGPNGFASTSANASILNVTTAATGNYTVVVTDASGCSATDNVFVTVSQTPATPVISANGPIAFCPGNSVTLTSSYGSGNLWSTAETTNSIVVSHDANISVTYSDGTCSATSLLTVINEYDTVPPTISVIGNTNICTGQTSSSLVAQLSGVTGPAIAYQWSNGETVSLITVSSMGIYAVTTTDIHGCETHAEQEITESNPPAAPIVTPAGPVTLCTDGNTTTSAVLTCTNYTSDLLWSTNETTTSITIDFADVFNVTYTDANGCFAFSNSVISQVLNNSIDPDVIVTDDADNIICLGNDIELTVSGGSLGDGADWVWYEGGCGTGVPIGSGSPITITPLSAGTHNYFVRAEGICNNSACVSVSVLVDNPAAVLHSITITSFPSAGCNGSTGTVTATSVAGASFYSWSGTGMLFNGNPGPFQTATPNVTVTFGALPAGQSGYNVCVFAGNGCGQTNTYCKWVRGKISQPGVINGSIIGCASSNSIYSITPVVGANNYTWIVTGNADINGLGTTVTTSSTSVTINFDAGFSTGTLCVYASMSCGYNSSSRCMNLSTMPAVPGTMAGPSYVCPNGSASFSVSAVSGATSYDWSCSVPGSVVSPGGTTCSISFPATIPAGAIVCVSAVSSCGQSSIQRCKGIASGLPGTPGNVTGPTTGNCNVTGVSFGVSTTSARATSYLWSITGGASIQLPNNLSGVSIDFPNNFSSGLITVNGVNACGDGGTRSLNVIGAPALPGAFSTGNAAPCSTTVETYTTSGSAGATSYDWNVPATSTILSSLPYGSSILVQIGNVSGNITVSATNDCGTSASRSFAITIGCRMNQVMASAGNDVSVYPNPTNDLITLNFIASTNENVQLKITDVLGRTVMSEMIIAIEGSNMHEADLSSLSKGVYLIHLNGANINEVVKVTVE